MKGMENVLMPIVIKGQDIHKRYVMGKDNYVDALQGALSRWRKARWWP